MMICTHNNIVTHYDVTMDIPTYIISYCDIRSKLLAEICSYFSMNTEISNLMLHINMSNIPDCSYLHAMPYNTVSLHTYYLNHCQHVSVS